MIEAIGWFATWLFGSVASLWIGAFFGAKVTKGQGLESFPIILMFILAFVLFYTVIFIQFLPLEIVYTG